jgi:hypothetical protein
MKSELVLQNLKPAYSHVMSQYTFLDMVNVTLYNTVAQLRAAIYLVLCGETGLAQLYRRKSGE